MALFKIDGVYASVGVGHDIHFPELSRLAVLGGSRICFYLAYEPADTSLYASESQVVCRSVESQTFTVFCNAGTGNAAGNSTGHSRIVSPWADVYAEAGTAGDSVIRYTIPTSSASYDYARAGAGTPSLLAYWQEGLDVLRLNNPEFYGDILIAPLIAEVSPDPSRAAAGMEYVHQLTLLQGYPPPTWSLVAGPSGAHVDGTGRVSGWTPTASQIGSSHTFQVRAENVAGSDTATWVARVASRADLDFDGDADQADFGLFQRCLSGSGVACDPACAPADLDADGTVDQDDFGLFRPCLAGSDQSPGC
jgi:hypothetical protein